VRAVFVALLLLASPLGMPVHSAVAADEETVTPLDPSPEQHVTGVAREDAERVDGVAATADEGVGPVVPPSPAERVGNAVAKVFISIAAAGVAVGAMLATLVFF
jgi:hypothetical protein